MADTALERQLRTRQTMLVVPNKTFTPCIAIYLAAEKAALEQIKAMPSTPTKPRQVRTLRPRLRHALVLDVPASSPYAALALVRRVLLAAHPLLPLSLRTPRCSCDGELSAYYCRSPAKPARTRQPAALRQR